MKGIARFYCTAISSALVATLATVVVAEAWWLRHPLNLNRTNNPNL